MAIPLTEPQEAALAGPEVTLCRLLSLRRRDGKTLRLTDHDVDIAVGGATYYAINSFTSTASVKAEQMQTKDVETKIIIDDDLITETDLIGGLYRDAQVLISLYDWKNGGTPFLTEVYWVGSLKYDGEIWNANLQSVSEWAKRAVGRTYTRDCDTNLFSSRCGLDAEDYKCTGTVTSLPVANQYNRFMASFTPPAPPISSQGYTFGKIKWISGDNLGQEMVLKLVSSGLFVTWYEPVKAVQVGDTFWLWPGCPKTRTACQQFGNLVNFQGFPFIKGPDAILKSPNRR